MTLLKNNRFIKLGAAAVLSTGILAACGDGEDDVDINNNPPADSDVDVNEPGDTDVDIIEPETDVNEPNDTNGDTDIDADMDEEAPADEAPAEETPADTTK